jgi:LmbE family N-acetylglucosaminyl deacetylase
MPSISGILAPTTQRETVPIAELVEGQGGEPGVEALNPEPRTPKVRRKKATTAAEKLEGRRLYLSEQVHFRLRMLAYQRGRKISEVAEEILDRGLPKYDVNRVG